MFLYSQQLLRTDCPLCLQFTLPVPLSFKICQWSKGSYIKLNIQLDKTLQPHSPKAPIPAAKQPHPKRRKRSGASHPPSPKKILVKLNYDIFFRKRCEKVSKILISTQPPPREAPFHPQFHTPGAVRLQWVKTFTKQKCI